MEKDRSARLIAIVALVLAVTGVSIGFAVLSTNLTIQPVEANVKANAKLFTVYFSSSKDDYETNSVVPTLSPSAGETDFKGNTISVSSDSTTLSGIGGTFTAPGQTITYELGVANTSKIKGYLTAISFKNPDSGMTFAKCEPVTLDVSNAASSEEATRACNDLTVEVYVNGTKYTTDKLDISKNEIEAKSDKPGMQTLKVVITYKADATPVTGDFKAKFGDIQLVYKTEDNTVI